MKKILIFCFLIALTLCSPLSTPTFADNDIIIYQIYDENNLELTQRENVEIGDKFIDRNFNEYEIYLVDETSCYAKARYIQTYPRPTVTKKSNIEPISNKTTPKKIALYMTHNDESYIIGDGTESIYGAGGIHDIAKILKSSLNTYGVDVTLDETLHIPHNSSAYTRSNVTAKKLLNNSPDAIFDIHRDGASRQYYVTKVNGKERSKVRIVLGQSNANSAENLQFALYMLSVAEVECPWLFHDIYWGKGHYNQALSNKALLFEMGTHTIEKSYVEESAKELAKVINATLYKTTVDEDDNTLTIGGNTNKPTVNEKFDETNPAQQNTNTLPIILIPTAIGALAIGGALIYFYTTSKSKHKNKKR